MKKTLFVIVPLIIIGIVVAIVMKFPSTPLSPVQDYQLSGDVISSGDIDMITSGATDILSGEIIINSGTTQSTSGTTTNIQSNNPLVYTNKEFGFQVTLPEGWEEYKAFIYRFKENDSFGRYVFISIALPTTESTWYGVENPNGKNRFNSNENADYIKGYADMILIGIWQPKEYKEKINQCNTKIDPGCIIILEELGNNKSYNFTSFGPTDLPDDIMNIWGSRTYFQQIIPTFKFL